MPIRIGTHPEQIGIRVAEPVEFHQAGGSGYREGMLVFRIDEDGLIAHQWMIGGVSQS